MTHTVTQVLTIYQQNDACDAKLQCSYVFV
nr:MAG TPA: hypothetical protein [Caudoviricetes sp.]